MLKVSCVADAQMSWHLLWQIDRTCWITNCIWNIVEIKKIMKIYQNVLSLGKCFLWKCFSDCCCLFRQNWKYFFVKYMWKHLKACKIGFRRSVNVKFVTRNTLLEYNLTEKIIFEIILSSNLLLIEK